MSTIGVISVQDSESSRVAEASPLSSPRHSQMVTSTYAVKRGPNGYGMILKAIRVYIGQTDDYRIHHIIEVCIKPTDIHVDILFFSSMYVKICAIVNDELPRHYLILSPSPSCYRKLTRKVQHGSQD